MASKTRKQKEQERVAQKSYLKDAEKRVNDHIKDNYPNVESISFEMRYIDPDGLTKPFEKSLMCGPDDYAIFRFDCPFKECVEGGHDLEMTIHEMIIAEVAEGKGVIRCEGWQDKSRINVNHCWCELHYKVTIEYKKI